MLSTHTHAHAHCVAEYTYVRSGVTSSRIFGCLSVSSAGWILEVIGKLEWDFERGEFEFF